MTTLSPLIQSVYEISKDFINEEVTLSGEKNLLSCNELDKMEILRFMENKRDVVKILDDSFSGIKVLFGNENSCIIGNSSFITSKFQKDGQTAGTLGVIGPMRINYSRIIPYVEYFTQKITESMSQEYAGKEEE